MTEDLTRNDTEGADGQLADGGSGGESQGFTGAEGFEQLAEGSEQLVGRPAPGDSVEISAEPGQTYVLDFDPSQARALVEGDNLILVFEDGGQIVFENLVNLAQLEDGPSIQYADMDIIALLQAQGIIPGVFDSFELIQPEPGQIILIQSELGQRFVINFDPAIAQVTVDGDNLIMTFSDGGQIVIAGLGSLTDQSDAPLFSIAGAEITSGTLMGTAAAISGGESGPDATATLETAAGGEEPVGTGATQYSDDTGDIIDTIGAQGVIPPTALEFDVPDPEPTDPIILPNPPVAFGSSVSAGEGELIGIPGAADTVGGFVYKFDVGEENDISDNIHGTDEEDGVTTAFTITSLPEFGVLVVDSGDDGTLDAVYGVSNAFIAAAAPLPPGGIEISSGDAVYYFLPIEQVFANEADGGLGGDSTSSTDSIVGSISVQFDYFTTDSSGLNSAESTLGVTFDAMPVVSATDGEVDEAALSDGSNPGSPNETDTGTFTINTFGDTLATVTVGGVDVTGGGVVNGTYGDLTVTETAGAYSWSYTLSDNTTDHPTNPSAGTSEGIADEFSVTVTDSDGDVSAEDTLTVAILDDGPDAVDDGVIAVAEDTETVIDVQTNDEPGADGVDFTDGSKVLLAADGSKGSAVYNDDGTFTYTPNPGATGADSFTYTITDGDGDTDTATVSVNIAPDSTPTVSVTDGEVDEAALSDGSNPGSPNETDTGTFTINTFGDSLAVVTVGGIDVTGGGVVNGTYGVLTVTETAGVYSWSYTLSDNTTDHPDDTSTGTSEGIADEFSVTVTDSDGDVSAEDTLTVAVLDDGPEVLAKTDLIFANTPEDGDSGTAVFDYSIGADDHVGAYSDVNSDFSTITLSGTVGGVLIVNPVVAWVSETDSQAVFAITFDYAPNSNFPDATVPASGTLTFDKDSGTYTVDLDIASFEILTTSNALDFQGWEIGTDDIQDNSGPADVVVAQLSDEFFVQFAGIDEPGGGAGADNIITIGDGDAGDFADGDLFAKDAASVTVSSTAAGVAGNTMQKGEVLDMDFFTVDPMGDTAADPNAMVTDLFFKFDGVGSEDLVVILKLTNADGSATTTKAIIVENSDIYTSGDPIPDDYAGAITLDNNDGVVIIESNDYNFSTDTETWFIEGAQVLVSTEDVTGDGINLDPTTGVDGGSEDDGTQSFDSVITTDGDVLKIVDIGFVTGESGSEDADLQFSFAVVDGDGDDTDTQTLDVFIENNGAFVGSDADESIQGSDGDNTITGGGGDDILTGNGGADTFVFDISVDEGTDTIVDFDSAEDMLSLLDVVDGGGDDVADVNAMIDTISNVDGHVAVNFSDGTTVEFANVAFASQTSIADLVDDASQIVVAHS